jgi:hypothetical protein
MESQSENLHKNNTKAEHAAALKKLQDINTQVLQFLAIGINE